MYMGFVSKIKNIPNLWQFFISVGIFWNSWSIFDIPLFAPLYEFWYRTKHTKQRSGWCRLNGFGCLTHKVDVSWFPQNAPCDSPLNFCRKCKLLLEHRADLQLPPDPMWGFPFVIVIVGGGHEKTGKKRLEDFLKIACCKALLNLVDEKLVIR